MSVCPAWISAPDFSKDYITIKNAVSKSYHHDKYKFTKLTQKNYFNKITVRFNKHRYTSYCTSKQNLKKISKTISNYTLPKNCGFSFLICVKCWQDKKKTKTKSVNNKDLKADVNMCTSFTSIQFA